MLGDPAELAARVEADPDDHDARYRLATVLFLRGCRPKPPWSISPRS